MEIFIILLIYLTDVINYSLGLKVVFKLQIERWWTFPACFFVYAFFVSNVDLNEDTMYFALYGMLLITMLVMVKCNSFRKLSRILLLMLALSSFEEGLEILFYALYDYDKSINGISSNWLSYLTGSITNVFLFLLVLVVKKYFGKYKHRIEEIVKAKMYYILVPVTVLLLFSAATLTLSAKESGNSKYIIFVYFISIFSFFSIGAIVSTMIYIRNLNIELEKLFETEKSLNTMKLKYYESLLSREEETKKYRHDLNNHLLCLSSLAKNSNLSYIESYINQMRKQFDEVQFCEYDVGNMVFNAMLNAHLAKLDKSVEVKVAGKCINKLKINDMDLCIIFSNLLQNAVEELLLDPSITRFLTITFKQGKIYLKVTISNSIHATKQLNVYNLKTTKSDRGKHGYGMKNVTETLRRNNGSLDVEINDGVFTISFFLENQDSH